jgi:mannosyltransferase
LGRVLTDVKPEQAGDTGTRAFVLVPVAVSAAVGLWGVGVPSFWRDESVSAMAASMPIRDLWRLLGDIDAVHGLYYLLLRPVAAFGMGELLLRLPSVLAMVLGAYGVTVLGRRLVTPAAGMFGGLVSALLPIVSRYGQEVRSYALVSAVAVLATLALVHALDVRAPDIREPNGNAAPSRGAPEAPALSRDAPSSGLREVRVLRGEAPSGGGLRGWASYLLYALCLVLLGWLHLYALLLVPAHAVTVLGLRRREFVKWAGAVLLAGAGIAPLAVIAAGQREAQLFWLGRPGVTELAEFGPEVAGWAAAALAVLVVIGARGRVRAWVLLPWGATPLLSFAISQVYPVYHPRYVLFAIPALALLGGAGMAALRLRRAWHGWAALALVAVLTIPAPLAPRRPDSRPDDLRALGAALSAWERPGDAVLYVPRRFRLFVAVYGDAYRDLQDLTFARGAAEPRTAAEFHAAARAVGRIWLVSPTIGSRWADDPRLAALRQDFVAGPTRLFGTVHLTLYTRA